MWYKYTNSCQKVLLIAYLIGASNCIVLHAQVDSDTMQSDTLAEVEITVTRSILRSNNLSASTHDVTKLITPSYSINELTNSIVGLFTTSSNNFAQDSRITSRGFGARSAFGIRGIRIITDDFPDTSPDGQSQLDNIDFSSQKNIEFLRGPQSGLYGNNSGGVLNLKSYDFNEENHVNAGFTYGSYGLKTARLSATIGNQKFKSKTGIAHTDYKGYRTWSNFKNTVVNSINEYRQKQHQFKLLLNYANSPVGNDPGGVNFTELENGRALARPANELFQAGEAVTQYKAGIKYSLKKEDQTDRFTFRTYAIKRDFSNNLPFENNGAVTIDRILYGINADYNLKYKWKGVQIGQKLGIEREYQNDTRKQFQNLKTNRGIERFNQEEIFKSQSIYLLNEIEFNKHFNFTINLRNDQINTEAVDQFLSNGNQSGKAKNSAWNYTFALNYFDKFHRYSLLKSSGFENPTLSELSNNPLGLGGFNTNLRPMKSDNIEVSINSRNHSKWSYNINVYRINTLQEIVGYEVAGQTGRTFFRNQGNTNRKGIELSTNLELTKQITLSYQHNYLVAKYSDSTAFVGNKLPGIPAQVVQIGLSIKTMFNTIILAENRYVGKIQLNDANMDAAKSYNELNLKLKKDWKIGKSQFTVQSGVNNLLNTSYFSNFRINAVAGRYYESAMPRNFFIGGNLRIG